MRLRTRAERRGAGTVRSPSASDETDFLVPFRTHRRRDRRRSTDGPVAENSTESALGFGRDVSSQNGRAATPPDCPGSVEIVRMYQDCGRPAVDSAISAWLTIASTSSAAGTMSVIKSMASPASTGATEGSSSATAFS
jgi:hypothetical protein